MKDESTLLFIKEKLREIERFCVENEIDCRLMFCGGMAWTGHVHLAKNILQHVNKTREWSGILLEIVLKDTDKADNVDSMKEIVGYLQEDINRQIKP